MSFTELRFRNTFSFLPLCARTLWITNGLLKIQLSFILLRERSLDLTVSRTLKWQPEYARMTTKKKISGKRQGTDHLANISRSGHCKLIFTMFLARWHIFLLYTLCVCVCVRKNLLCLQPRRMLNIGYREFIDIDNMDTGIMVNVCVTLPYNVQTKWHYFFNRLYIQQVVYVDY